MARIALSTIKIFSHERTLPGISETDVPCRAGFSPHR